jgi:hypothetical protein
MIWQHLFGNRSEMPPVENSDVIRDFVFMKSASKAVGDFGSVCSSSAVPAAGSGDPTPRLDRPGGLRA